MLARFRGSDVVCSHFESCSASAEVQHRDGGLARPVHIGQVPRFRPCLISFQIAQLVSAQFSLISRFRGWISSFTLTSLSHFGVSAEQFACSQYWAHQKHRTNKNGTNLAKLNANPQCKIK